MTDSNSKGQSSVLPIPSATLLITRDGEAGLEVFMLVRNREVDFASGALVFPGGKVDPQDTGLPWADLAPLDAAHPERSLWVAALRETFEETGLLLADDGETGAPIDAMRAIRLTLQSQLAVAQGTRPFADLLRAERLTLATTRMVHFAHWITPVTMPKRFDTHFFLAEAPAGQVAVHDGGEAIESVWITPRRALAEAEAGRRTLVPATALNLEKLAGASTVDEAFAQAQASRIVTITPEVARAKGGVTISIPANAGYATTSMFVPRPSAA